MAALAVRGVELDWSESGEGASALLVHETAVDRSVWAPVTEALHGGVRAIAYDRRGWGASTAPDGYLRTTIEEQSEDAAVLVESLDAGPAVLCGAGTGAFDVWSQQARGRGCGQKIHGADVGYHPAPPCRLRPR